MRACLWVVQCSRAHTRRSPRHHNTLLQAESVLYSETGTAKERAGHAGAASLLLQTKNRDLWRDIKEQRNREQSRETREQSEEKLRKQREQGRTGLTRGEIKAVMSPRLICFRCHHPLSSNLILCFFCVTWKQTFIINRMPECSLENC